jgi:hypothetical protein
MCLVLALICSIFAMEMAELESVRIGIGNGILKLRLFRTPSMCRTSFAISEIAMYSDSDGDVAMQGVILDVQEITLPFMRMRYPNDECCDGILLPKLASEYAVMVIGPSQGLNERGMFGFFWR